MHIIAYIYIFLVHLFLVNPAEKLFCQQVLPDQRRPQCLDNNKTLACYGFPSGHAEIATLLVLLLVLHGVHNKRLDWVLGVLVVFLICAQRILAGRHTLTQVLAGIALGVVYFGIYSRLFEILLVASVGILVPLCLLILVMFIVDGRLRDETKDIPAWVSPEEYALIDAKRSIPWPYKLVYLSSLLFFHKFVLFKSWADLEADMDRLTLLSTRGSNVDCVIGMKTGGAIMSDYVSRKLNVPNHYMKFASKCDKSAARSLTDLVRGKSADAYELCLGIDADLEGQDVLLLDECTSTGNTLLKSRAYLLGEKRCRSVRMACIQKSKDIRIEGLVYLTSDIVIVWPWGYDN